MGDGMPAKIRIFCSIAAVFSLATAAYAAPPALYSAAQATAGAAGYQQNCASCHGADLKGVVGPALIGQAFAAPAKNATVGSIFTEIAKQMPLGQAGSLSHAEYEGIMAYILKQNGYPAGGKAFVYDKGLTDTTPVVSAVP
jgi:mono/diheme cytochrome c family protein